MHKQRLPAWLRHLLVASATHRYYPLVMGALAFGVTMTFSFPFAALLVPATLLAPKRWLSLGSLCGLGSGLGAAVLVGLFHHLGWEVIAQRYPELIQSDALQWAGDWLRQYGALALLVIAASPVPHTPALLVYAMVDPQLGMVVASVGLGRGLKYTALAWLTARFPGRFVRYPLSTDEPPPTPLRKD